MLSIPNESTYSCDMCQVRQDVFVSLYVDKLEVLTDGNVSLFVCFSFIRLCFIVWVH